MKYEFKNIYLENIIFILLLLIIINYKKINKKIDDNIKEKKLLIKYIIYFLPIIILIYSEFNHNIEDPLTLFFSTDGNIKLRYILEIIGAYGIIQVLSQDLGIKTGINQRNLVQHPVSQFIVLYAGAYLIGRKLNQAFIATLIFFVLKYNISNNITSNVCFEDV